MRIRTRYLPLLLAVLLVIIAASRILRLDAFRMDTDEVWTIWQTFGTPQQIIQWTPPSETPLYYLLLGLWKGFTGIDPIVIRSLSVLGSLVGSALMYRAARRVHGEPTAILAMLAYGALALNIVLSMYARSYFIAVSALPLALWLAARYFDHPGFKRAVPLALCLLVLYGSTITVVPAFVILGLYTLVVYRQRIWRWWLPGILAAPVALLDIVSTKLRLTASHTSAARVPLSIPLPQAVAEFFAYFTGVSVIPILWLAMVGIAAALVLRGPRKTSRGRAFYWLFLALAIPVVLYILEPQLGFYTLKRYAWWYMLPLALWVGFGLSYLPRIGQAAASALLVALTFVPFRANAYSYVVTPLGDNLKQLAQEIHPGDVLLLDPANQCSTAEEWDYYTRLYFPKGLFFVTQPEGYRRVWYVSSIGKQTPKLEQKLNERRIAGEFIGPPKCLFRVYEAAPDEQGILFENGMRFHGVEVLDGDADSTGPIARREGETVRLRLWWSVDAPVTLDYSVGLRVVRGSDLIVQNDSAPNVIYPDQAPHETSRWIPGQYYVEERELRLPYPMKEATLSINLVVYWFQDADKRFAAPGVNDQNQLPIRQIFLKSWW
jgi:hypothetical protein